MLITIAKLIDKKIKVNNKNKKIIPTMGKNWIEIDIKKQNWNTVKIYLKFWGRHESRNQDKIWHRESLTTTFEKGVEELFNLVINNYSNWISSVNDFFNFYNDIFIIKAEETLTNFLEPNFILKIKKVKELNDTKNYLNRITNDKYKTESKINKCNKKITKKEHSAFFIKLFKTKYLENIQKWKNKLLDNSIQLVKIEKELIKINDDITRLDKLILKYSNPNVYSDNIKIVKNNKEDSNLEWLPSKIFLSRGIELKGKKGIYIIWNESKNKYYVGQSKDLYSRICLQHFNNESGECKNPHFRDDYNGGDIFSICMLECQTKDELDNLEKEYIDLFDSFYNGYNKTGGNK